jgi:hypothetical protein
MQPKTRGHHEVESDCHKTFELLAGCFDVIEPDADTWRHVIRLCERLTEEAGRAVHHAHTREVAAKVRAMCSPPSEREAR